MEGKSYFAPLSCHWQTTTICRRFPFKNRWYKFHHDLEYHKCQRPRLLLTGRSCVCCKLSCRLWVTFAQSITLIGVFYATSKANQQLSSVRVKIRIRLPLYLYLQTQNYILFVGTLTTTTTRRRIAFIVQVNLRNFSRLRLENLCPVNLIAS